MTLELLLQRFTFAKANLGACALYDAKASSTRHPKNMQVCTKFAKKIA